MEGFWQQLAVRRFLRYVLKILSRALLKNNVSPNLKIKTGRHNNEKLEIVILRQ